MDEAVNQTQWKLVDSAQDWLRGLGASLMRALPSRCLLCGLSGQAGRDLCLPCQLELASLGPHCRRCALPMGAMVDACPSCQARPPAFASVQAVFQYGGGVDELIPRLKFHQELAAGRVLAQLMTDAAQNWSRPQALIPMPLHPERLRQRGFNQAEVLAKPLARALELPMRADLLSRRKPTQAQSRLSKAQRAKNLRDSFLAHPQRGLPAHVALLDDVLTTGATAEAAARCLLDAGVQEVEVWVVARVA